MAEVAQAADDVRDRQVEERRVIHLGTMDIHTINQSTQRPDATPGDGEGAGAAEERGGGRTASAPSSSSGMGRKRARRSSRASSSGAGCSVACWAAAGLSAHRVWK